MDIKRVKEELKHSLQAYFAKDMFGEYKIPVVRQRPILLIGPPGIGKTAIMEQVARDGNRTGFLYHHSSYKTKCNRSSVH